MAVTYQIDRVNRIIRTKCTGAVTIEEVLDHFRDLKHNPDCPERLDVLLDLSQQTSIPKRENMEEVAEAIRRIQGRVQFGVCAIIACQDALFGMLRMLEVFAERYFSASCVFRSTEEAEAWLASQNSTTSATP